MSIFGDLREFLKTTLDGRLPVDKQVTMLMEAASLDTKEEIMGMSGRVPFTAYSPPPPAASTSGPPPRKASTTAIDDPLTPIKGTKRSMFRQIFKMSRRFRKRGGQNGAKPR